MVKWTHIIWQSKDLSHHKKGNSNTMPKKRHTILNSMETYWDSKNRGRMKSKRKGPVVIGIGRISTQYCDTSIIKLSVSEKNDIFMNRKITANI